jgi:hypothetical protein
LIYQIINKSTGPWNKNKKRRQHYLVATTTRGCGMRGRIKGVEGWEGGELEGENKRGGGRTGTGAL